MNGQSHNETGDTLIEIILAMVVIGLVVGAFFATFSTQASGSTAQRNLVTADNVLRGYAEATKSAVREQCASGSQYSVTFAPPSGYAVNALTNQACPPTAAPGATFAVGQPWAPLVLTVTLPNGQTRSMHLVVRSP